jgi:predicted esterase/catechol 2,3-dioxygenase-like lactoylglutathione lyase family enzyme
MESAELSMPHLVRPPKMGVRKPPLLLLLHGMGSSEKDIFSIADTFDDRFNVVTVRGPFMQAPKRYLWFGVEHIGNTYMMNAIQTEFSRQALIKFIPQVVQAYKMDTDQVYVLGFSQGAVMSLALMLTEPDLLAGAIVINGQIPVELRSLMVKPEQMMKGFPVLVIHGVHDEVYPISQGRAIYSTLSSYPVILDYREQPTGHFLSQEGIADACAWLTARLDASSVSGIPEPPEYKVKLGHVQLKVRNLERAIRFYIRFLGLKLVERTGNTYAFLSSSNAHHEIALQNIGFEAPATRQDGAGLYHIGFEVPDPVSFAQVYKTLVEAGIQVTTVDHLVRWAIYLNDPDGNGLEIYWDTRGLPGKSDLWQGRDLPLLAEKILAILVE